MVIAFNCRNKKPDSIKNINPFKYAALSVETFHIKDKGWGFDIYVNGKAFIHHEKPQLSSLEGYANEQDAVKVSKLVISKIRSNKLPPVISFYELDSLDIRYK